MKWTAPGDSDIIGGVFEQGKENGTPGKPAAPGASPVRKGAADRASGPRGGRIILFILIRTIVNTGYRAVYPFLPAFGRGLGVDLRTLSSAVSIRAGSGALAPLISPLTDRYGRPFGMALGAAFFTAGAALVFAGRNLALFAAGLVGMTIGKYVLDGAILAYIGDRTPYERRALVVALTELSWSLAFIVGVPAAGFIMARRGWNAPFLPLVVLGSAVLVLGPALVRNNGGAARAGSAPKAARFGTFAHLANYRAVFTSAAAVTALTAVAFVGVSNEILNVTFGAWLEDSFGLKLAALGIASAMIGAAEFAGESLVAGTADRLGKTNAVAIGLLVNTVMAVVLPFTRGSAAGAVAGLAVFYCGFEYTVVSMVPIMSEILPGARATLIAFYAAALSIGRAVGALLAPRLYSLGFPAAAAAAALLSAAALIFTLRLKRLPLGAGPS